MAQQRKHSSNGRARLAHEDEDRSSAVPARTRTESSMRPKAATRPEMTGRPEPGGDGYDAGEGPLDTGLASESVELSEILDTAASDGESLSLDAEDLGSHTLRAAVQQDAVDGSTRRAFREEATISDSLPQTDEFDELDATNAREEDDEDEELDDTTPLDEESDAESEDEDEDARADREDDDETTDPDSPGESTMEPAAVDLARNEIRNGSLFDQPRKGEVGQVRHPLVKTNEVDVTMDQKRRAQRARRPSARRGKH
jgi:hypothetical protein